MPISYICIAMPNGKFTRIECPGDMILRTSFASHADRMMYTASNTDYPPRIYTLNLTDKSSGSLGGSQRRAIPEYCFRRDERLGL